MNSAALLEANRAVRIAPTPQRPGRSKQTFGTPPAFAAAVARRFGTIAIDLAASADNTLAPRFISESEDSLSVDWQSIELPAGQIAWLNPPFGRLRDWAKKCETVRMMPRWTLMLCPASVGSVWWWKHVEGKCFELGISRMQFLGADKTYPKDLALLCYGFGVSGRGNWAWKKQQ